MLNTYEQRSKNKLATTIVAIIVVAGLVVFADQIKSHSAAGASNVAITSGSPPPATTGSRTPATGSSAGTTSAASYKDGTYSASSDYFVPPGSENIKVTATLQNGTITNVSIVNSEGDRSSAMFQRDFASVYKSYVVGKQISGLQLSVIAGASDTTQGFNDALNQIASQARA